MNLWNRLAKLWSSRSDDREFPHSVVLLQRTARFFSKNEVEKAAEAGWGKRFDGQDDPIYFVVQKGEITIIKAGIYVVHLIHANQPYLGDPQEVAKQLPREEQRIAWRQHNTWASFDLWNEGVQKAEAYAALAKFALNLGDENCAGVYLPKEEIFMPNDGTAEEGLRLLMRKELLPS